jgi:hypothetical protein
MRRYWRQIKKPRRCYQHPEARTQRAEVSMSSKSLAHTAHTDLGEHYVPETGLEPISSVAPAILERIERGRRLFAERGEDFVHEAGIWFITSDTIPGRVYEANVNRGTCECSDFQIRNVACKHLTAATIAHAKSVVCDCCGHRVLGRFVSEVEEEDGLLSWYPGQRICSDCERAGYWS